MLCDQGALAAGGDLAHLNLTIAAARAWCGSRIDCGGFTTRAAYPLSCTNDTAIHGIYFKSQLGGNADPRWSTWAKPNWTSPYYHCVSGKCKLCPELHSECDRVTYIAADCLGLCPALPAAASPAPPLTRLGLYVGEGAGPSKSEFYATLGVAATAAFGRESFSIRNLTGPDVAQLRPADFDVVLFPGGSGNGQAKGVGDAGLAALRTFVRSGKGYIGTCGGAFLALQHVQLYGSGPKGHGPTTQEPFDRGDGNVSVAFTPRALAMLVLPSDWRGTNVTISYDQGPIVKAADLPGEVVQLAFFKTEVHKKHANQTTGEMVGTPAITALDGYGGAGGGRVVLNSPHPELAPLHPSIYAGELRWVTGGKGT